MEQDQTQKEAEKKCLRRKLQNKIKAMEKRRTEYKKPANYRYLMSPRWIW